MVMACGFSARPILKWSTGKPYPSMPEGVRMRISSLLAIAMADFSPENAAK